MNRTEYLAWAKSRALEYAEAGEFKNAYTSLASDLGKHPETQGHAGIRTGMMMMVGGQLDTKEQVVNFINTVN